MRYEIHGDVLPVVIMNLDEGEQLRCENGAMAWMSHNMKMQTTSGGGIGKMFGRMLSGEKLFQNIYTAEDGPGLIACASDLPGMILPFEITPDEPMILQKHAYLCSEMGVELSIHLQRAAAGFFSGEGFILNRVEGEGLCFAELDGQLVEYDLEPGETMVISSGHLAAATASCDISVETVKGAKNMFLGGEGFFLTSVTGPGHVWLQSMPVPNLANALMPYMPKTNS